MSNKPFVCFCVDGASDIQALKLPFEDLFDDAYGNNINIDFRYAGAGESNKGDITSLNGVEPDNIEKYIYKHYFKKLDKNADLGWADLSYLIHIIDLDGLYTNDDFIHTFDDCDKEYVKLINDDKKVIYHSDHISVKNFPKDICDRNKRKRRNIEYLRDLTHITAGNKTVKYALYYFSTNLDHFLYNERNLAWYQKKKKASEFVEDIIGGEEFLTFLKDTNCCEFDDYYQSWESLRRNNNSLKRGSNINILVHEIKNNNIEHWL